MIKIELQHNLMFLFHPKKIGRQKEMMANLSMPPLHTVR
jgi:hypothetical protein